MLSREPLIGYNHNLRYKDRVFHVQTEDSGLSKPHIKSHVFFKGAVLSSASTDYANLANEPDHVDEVIRIMRGQHKQLMRQLLRGELDGKIVSVLGSLEPVAEGPKVRRYCHRYQHAGRVYEVQTTFYASVTTDLFWEDVLLLSEHDDCRVTCTAGSPEVEQRAQLQHKQMIRRLRDGELDRQIVGLLGTLEPPRDERKDHGVKALLGMVQSLPGRGERSAEERTLEHFHHSVRHGERVFQLTTYLYASGIPHVITELHQGETLLTRKRQEKRAGLKELRRLGQEQHKQVLRELRDGELEETIALLEEMEALGG